ncbi:MAG: class I SAM-dependent methyltransferase [Chloroflexota bacterium]|nr:MAG: class I SAM-dependent methyltransferase [Chloroflexota bacterium]
MSSEPVIRRVSLKISLSADDPDDFVGYEVLMDFIKQRALHKLEGDIIEIGAYMGRGTAKLAEFAQRYGKKVYAIDLFDPNLDKTISKSGIKAGDVYEAFLQGRSMLEAYRESTRGLDNIVTMREDSKNVGFPEEQKFIFGFIDGCHQQSYVENDFNVIWPHLASGGALGFHDYKFDDWPEITKAVEKLIHEHKREISEAYEIEGKYNILSLLLIKK